MDTLRVLDSAELADVPTLWPLVGHQSLAVGAVAEFVNDVIETPGGDLMRRQYLLHPGAVAILALDDQDRVVVVRQYRHPAGFTLTEIPAGLLDPTDATWLDAAQRELAEEAMLAASDWRVLVDFFATPGSCQESCRIFLARGLTQVERPEGFDLEHEEAHMDVCLASLDDLVAGIFAGRLQSPTLTLGVLALFSARLSGTLDALRTPEAPWVARDMREQHDQQITALGAPGDGYGA